MRPARTAGGPCGFGKWGCGDRGTTGVPEKHGFDVFYGYYNQKHAHTFYPRYLVRNSDKIPLEGNTGSFHEGETFSHELIYHEAIDFIRDHLGYFPDIMPTLAELAGLGKPETVDGISIVPTLLGRGGQATHPYLYWEDPKSKAVRMGNWKAIQPAKNKPFELYDLGKDIEEQDNIAGDHPEILAKLEA